MFHILLLIFKIIGIVLLSLLVLLLVLLFLILFIPLRYKIKSSYHSALTGIVKVTWLLHIISVTFAYTNGKVEKKIRIFGIPFRKFKKKKRVHKSSKKNDRISVENGNETINADRIVGKTKQESFSDERGSGFNENIQKETVQKEKIPFQKKLSLFFKMILDKVKNFKYTLDGIYDKLISIKDDIDFYIDFLQDEHNIEAIKLCFEQAGVMIKHVKPRKVCIDIIVGTEDPATLGSILAVLGIIYPFFYGGLRITPNFEQSIFDMDADVRGHITMFVFLKVAWIIYFNKNFKRMMNTLKGRQ